MNGLIDLTSLTGVTLTAPIGWTDFGAPETFVRLPDVHKSQILFLNKASSNAVYAAFNSRDLLCGDDGWGNTPFSAGCFQSVSEYQINTQANLKKWLYQRGIAFAANALLLHPFSSIDDAVVLTTWKIVVKYAHAIFSRDNIIVVSPKADWCLHYHHDGLIRFAKNPVFNKLSW